METEITSATAAIEALGGTRAVADIFSLDYRVVHNWHQRGIPGYLYRRFDRLLRERGLFASEGLFHREPGFADTVGEAGE